MPFLRTLPFFLLLPALASLAMFAPALVAIWLRDHHDARSFFYAGLIGLILTTLVALAVRDRNPDRAVTHHLLTLCGGLILLPVMLAVPFHEALQTTSFLNAYFEMVSCLTTTGATLFEPDRLSAAENLWRAQVAWLGGFLMWVSAAAVMAPLTLGGFEVIAPSSLGQATVTGDVGHDLASPLRRLARSSRDLFPLYVGLTLILWVLLAVLGDAPLVALIHAMSVLSTSGITPLSSLSETQSGLAGEALLFLFMFFALSRLTFSTDTVNSDRPGLAHDPEFRIGLVLLVGVTAALMLRHWLASFDVNEEENLGALLQALWGALFTVMSFLTTTGFESADWDAAQAWSGLDTPGLILMGLALMGGGVATTAGGVKLLRVFALYLNGAREIQKLVHPSSIGQAGRHGRRVQREGAFIAWVFFMLFAISIAAVTCGLALMNVPFEDSVLMSVAALSNTGPLITAGANDPVSLTTLTDQAKLLLCAAMVLGRLEVLAIIAMLTPVFWRN
ncbi:MAG: TrkH family potassium uptake protein [Rhodobacteraceae bacterium]|nr:TrkH family potassium uptake protein [Paracoccaceae bacterium]